MSAASDPFAGLDDELARWRDAGLVPRIWLRDDDAVAPTAALDRLLALAGRHGAPVLLAIVAAPAEESLAERLAEERLVTPAVHGYLHRNHARADAKKTELTENPPDRDVATVIRELAAARRKLAAQYGPRLSGTLVPPWNRISPAVAESVAAAGFSALSLFGWAQTASTLPHLNTHVDLIDWRNGRVGRNAIDAGAILAARLGEARMRGGAPIGLLTHHLVHDDTAWATLEILLGALSARGIFLSDAASCLEHARHV